jgi:23S rRNA (adenine2503-C2)-methyltransferase
VEYTMLDGVNDDLTQARALAELLRGLLVHVNLIPFNPWQASGFASSPGHRIEAFQRVLERAGVRCSVRFSRGRDAGGACGQLSLQGPGAQVASSP